MMGIGPDQAKRLSYWEYGALIHNWAVRHSSGEDDDEVAPPDADFVEHRHAMLARSGLGIMVH